METKIIKDDAKTVYINHPTASYSVFCYNNKGDLFIGGDWGTFSYMWRAFGEQPFEKFLSGLNTDYLIGKLEIDYRIETRKKLAAHKKENLTVLCQEFINSLKAELNKEQ